MLCHRPVCVTKKGDIVGWKFRVDDDDKPGFKDNLKAKDEKSWVVLGNGCKPNGLRLAPDPLEDDGHLMMTDASGKEFRFNGVGVFNTIGHGYEDMRHATCDGLSLWTCDQSQKPRPMDH